MLKPIIFYFQKLSFLFTIILTLQLVLGCEYNPLTRLENFTDIASLEDSEIIKRIMENDDLRLCNNDNFLLSEENTTIYELKSTEYLIEVFCFVGAYQGTYQYILYDANQAEHQLGTLSFTIFDERGESLEIGDTSLLTGYPEFDSETQMLTVDRKARGLGDCGSYAVYQWQNNSFNLVEYRHKGECDGIYIPVEEYPLIYP